MIKKIFFPVILLLLGWAFFISPTIKEVAAGVAILLFGMIMLEEGFNAFVEGPLQKLLRRVTDKLYKSLGLGFIVTAVLQSSSLISVITISFLSAGLIELVCRNRDHFRGKFRNHSYCLASGNFWFEDKSIGFGNAHACFWNPLRISKVKKPERHWLCPCRTGFLSSSAFTL